MFTYCKASGAKVLLLFVLIQLGLCFAASGTDYPPVTYLGIEQGLSNNSVRCIYQDKSGFMWFGTYDGLNRYDGYQFKVFRNRLNDSTSLPHNYIYAINEDGDGNIWVGTGQGIGIYNPLTSLFSPAYYTPMGTRKKEKMTYNATVIRCDVEGTVYIGTNGAGLLVKPKGRTAAMQIPYVEAGVKKQRGNIRAIKIGADNTIWVYIHNIGLCVYEKKTQSIRLVNNELVSAHTMEVDGDYIWFGSNNGLYKYHIPTNTLSKSYSAQSGSLTSDIIVNLKLDKRRNLWISTEGGGVNVLHIPSNTFSYFMPGARTNRITSESVYAVYNDNEARIWIGTLKGGINLVDRAKNRFTTIAHDPLVPNSLINNFVSSFSQDERGNIWVGTDGGGLSVWNRHQNSFTNYKHQSSANALSHNSVTSLLKDHNNYMWIATFGGGINRYNKATGSFKQYRCMNAATGEENKLAWLLFEDSEKVLWATTFSNGKLYRYNPEKDRFEVFDQELNNLIAFMEDRQGALWGGDAYNLYQIDKKTKKHKVYSIDKPVRSIYEDKNGAFWVGTEGGGLILFDRKRGKIIARYSDEDGLCNNAVLNILEDGHHQLWLSTFNGLSKFDPATKKFKNYYQEDGLQSNQFLYNSALLLHSGEMLFGGIKGFTIFHPDSILTRTYMPPVVLTGLAVNNNSITQNSPYVTAVGHKQITALKIPYNEAVLSFSFAALEFSAPGKIKYAYYLKGWDKSWNYTGDARSANYTNLREGDYVFRIKATNSEGIWNQQEVSIRVTVMPPWYRSWWAYTLYLLMVGALVYFYQQYKVRKNRLEYEVAIARLHAEKEHAEWAKEKTERERAQAEYEKTQAQYLQEKAERETERMKNEQEKNINEKRLSFFTNISHEFRTPLTLIINPVKDLLKKNNEEGDLKTIYRNARRLLSLVDQLLLFRKADTDGDELHLSQINFYSLCKEVYLVFMAQARHLGLNLVLNFQNEALVVYADRKKVEIMLYNLLSNALKYTPRGGQVTFAVTETETDVEILVSDTGCGIPADVGNQLFERFYQVKGKGVPSKAGFGIGLYLVKQFVDAHKGHIWYKSTLAKGTTFGISLQKGTQHFAEYKIYEEIEESLLPELVHEAETAVVNDNTLKPGCDNIIQAQPIVLIIDDDTAIRQYIRSVFATDYTTYEAANAEDGLQMARQLAPDIIISDVNMEGLNGIELCKVIKKDDALSHIPVILLTGSASAESRLEGVEGGADDYITKPFEKDLLVARVAALLKTRTQLQRYFYNEITLQNNTLKISAEYKEFLERCIFIVEKHLDNEQFNVKTLATELGMSHSALYKKIKAISSQSANSFIRFIRLRKAAELLLTTDTNINEAAFAVGMNDIKYFRAQFKSLFGVNPSEYLKKYKEPFSEKFTLGLKKASTIS